MVTRPGEHTKSYGKIHHAINGKIHYFDWAIFSCYVSSPEGTSGPSGEKKWDYFEVYIGIILW